MGRQCSAPLHQGDRPGQFVGHPHLSLPAHLALICRGIWRELLYVASAIRESPVLRPFSRYPRIWRGYGAGDYAPTNPPSEYAGYTPDLKEAKAVLAQL